MANYSLRESLKQLGRKILGSCVNSCVSTATNLPLAANQGKVLQDQINTLNNNLNISKDSFIDTINEKIEFSGFSCCKVGSLLQLYSFITVKDDTLTGTDSNPIIIASINYKPNIRYVLGTFQKNAVPYNIVDTASFWITNDGKISMYGKLPAGQYYMCVAYITR